VQDQPGDETRTALVSRGQELLGEECDLVGELHSGNVAQQMGGGAERRLAAPVPA
jgi:hypothetical protein